MTASRVINRRELINVIKRFKFEELENTVIPIFPEISWSYVKSKLIKNHNKFTTRNAVRIIEEILNVRITFTYNFYKFLSRNIIFTRGLFVGCKFKREGLE